MTTMDKRSYLGVKGDEVIIGHKGPRNIDELPNKGAGDAGDTGKIHQEMDRLKSDLAEVEGALKSTPRVAEIDALRSQIEVLQSRLGDAKGNYTSLIDALEGRVNELQATAALGTPKAEQPEGLRAVAEAVRESSGYKGLYDASGRAKRFDGFSEPVKIPGIIGSKAADVNLAAGISSGIDNTIWRPGILSEPMGPASLMSRIPKVGVSGLPTYTVPQETEASRFGAVHSLLAAGIDGDPTPKNSCTVTDGEGFMVGGVIKIYAATGGALLGSGTIVTVAGTTITVGDDEFDFDASSGDRAVCENFGATAEGGTKPSGHVGLTYQEFNLQTLAQLLPVTTKALKTWSGLRGWIEGKLPARLARNLSYHLLKGTGTAPQLAGFRAKAGAQSYSWSAGEVGDNRCDAIIRAASLLPWTSPIGVVMHQHDLALMTQEKAADGHYLLTNAHGAWPLINVGGAWYLGPWELVFDFASGRNEFTAINWLESSELVESDDAELSWGYINDDYAKNIIRCRYEASMVHAIFGTWGFIVGTWDSAPSAV